MDPVHPSDVPTLLASAGYSPVVVARVGALWGKSAEKGGGTPSLLVAHLLDAAAVAEVMWDEYLAVGTKEWINRAAGGDGRRLLAWICGIHDVGKATPAFQSKVEALADGVRATGLEWQFANSNHKDWHHTRAGGAIVADALLGAGWSGLACEWLPAMLTGHHGQVPATPGRIDLRRNADGHGRSTSWTETQRAVLDVVGLALGYEGLPPEPSSEPTKSQQLHLLGLVIMADWIASNSDVIPGMWDMRSTGLGAARGRTRSAWEALGLRGGWGVIDAPEGDVVEHRFGLTSRPLQTLTVEAARTVAAPALLVVEAPMGEGKTEAALAAAEVLAARFGADGIFVGMPTQATSDPMYHRVRRWADSVQAGLPVALLHGRARFNPEWKAALDAAARRDTDVDRGFDEYELDDPYGVAPTPNRSGPPANDVVPAPAHWFLGRGRPLLTPLAVGTIDQVLMVGTRTHHVMLRFAGLAGKVVVLDEVHSADVYMSRFLHEALWWLGQARVPVVLLSATLPPAQRTALIGAYLAGASGCAPDRVEVAADVEGYPSVVSAYVEAGARQVKVSTASPRPGGDRKVRVTVLPEQRDDPDGPLVQQLTARLVDGGCVLVIRNTVARAQQTYAALRDTFGADVMLLHARLTAGDRATRTERALAELGAPPAIRPQRRIVVATQLAEQSFDIDADLVVTDLAPIDLVLQRVGRLHRHTREARPEPLVEPEVVVTGFALGPDGLPVFEPGSEAIYTSHLLLRSASLVLDASRGPGWDVPHDIRDLVSVGYGDPRLPSTWAAVAAAAEAEWADRERQRVDRASAYALTRNGSFSAPTIVGLHHGATVVDSDEDGTAVAVRDGERSVEVVLVRRDDRGYHAWNGRPLGPNGDSSVGVIDDVASGLVRLPARAALTRAALQLAPLPGWAGHPWLGQCRALVLTLDRPTSLGGFELRYDPELGLIMGRA